MNPGICSQALCAPIFKYSRSFRRLSRARARVVQTPNNSEKNSGAQLGRTGCIRSRKLLTSDADADYNLAYR
jgi:hypothetical protein